MVHELLVYADVNILGGSVHTINENTALLVPSMEIRLQVNADKTTYMVMSQDQTAGRRLSMKIDNNCFESVKEFKYLGTTLTNQNSIQEEIKRRLNSGNSCYQSVQNPLCARLLTNNLKFKTSRIII
jgi:hypothetical protein